MLTMALFMESIYFGPSKVHEPPGWRCRRSARLWYFMGWNKKIVQEGAEMLGLNKPDVEWSMST
jgi:hypothetical protein